MQSYTLTPTRASVGGLLSACTGSPSGPISSKLLHSCSPRSQAAARTWPRRRRRAGGQAGRQARALSRSRHPRRAAPRAPATKPETRADPRPTPRVVRRAALARFVGRPLERLGGGLQVPGLGLVGNSMIAGQVDGNTDRCYVRPSIHRNPAKNSLQYTHGAYS